jgi:hypothetical protein
MDKLSIAAIVNQINWAQLFIYLKKIIPKVRAHTKIIGNELIDKLANVDITEYKIIHALHKHTTHPCRLVGPPSTMHDEAIWSLHTFINKEHMIRETAMGKHEFTYVNMWVSNEQINHKLSNSFRKARGIHNAQITPNSNCDAWENTKTTYIGHSYPQTLTWQL